MPLHASDLSPDLAKRLGLFVKVKRSKYGAVKQTVDGERFDSAREAKRYGELVYRQKAGEIENLQRQPVFYITRDGQVIARYTADFRYALRGTGTWIVEDVKGGTATKTEAYRLRKALVEAQYGITVVEV